MEYRKILLDAEGEGGGGADQEKVEDSKIISEWTEIMGLKRAAKEAFDALSDIVKAQISEEGGAYYGDTSSIIGDFNGLVQKFQSEFIDEIDAEDPKIAQVIDEYKGYQNFMDQTFGGAGGDSGSGSSTTSIYS